MAQEKTQTKVVNMPVSALQHWGENPRFINDKRYEELKDSIRTLGFNDVLKLAADKKTVIGGNMRLRALNDLGIEYVDCIITEAKTPQDMFRVAIRDNESFGEYNRDELVELASKLMIPEVELDTYMVQLDEPQSILDLLREDGEQDIEEDEVPEVDEQGEPESKLGEIYQLGRHRVMCGDSTDKANVELLMDGNKADMVFTDPPYGVDYSGGIQFTKDGVKKNQRERLKDDQYGTDIYTQVIPIIASITNGAVYTWFAGSKGKSVYEAIENVGDIHALIIWKKNGGYSSMNANYKENKEPCLYWKPKNGKLNFIGKTTETTVWDLDKEGKNEYHPTQKPIALCAKAINNHSGVVVADLFLGSGSTLIACEQTDRTCYGMELDPKYVDVIRKRYANHIGKGESWQTATPKVN